MMAHAASSSSKRWSKAAAAARSGFLSNKKIGKGHSQSCAPFFIPTIFEQWVQQPRCFDYARTKAVPDIEQLRFDGVGIASNQYRGHHCNFTDIRTQMPVLVRFDEADVPTGLDTLQVCCMIVPLIICGLIASVFWERYYRQSATRS
jgi:hypothetical protein